MTSTTVAGIDLMELADRVEAATGPDRDLDMRVLMATRGKSYRWAEFGGAYRPDAPKTIAIEVMPDWMEQLPLVEVLDRTDMLVCPSYTASLDAAMSLVPDQWEVEAIGQTYGGSERGKWHCGIYTRNPGLGPRSSTNDPSASAHGAASAALALTAAALRARVFLIEEERS